jgi:hypothetical protein
MQKTAQQPSTLNSYDQLGYIGITMAMMELWTHHSNADEAADASAISQRGWRD